MEMIHRPRRLRQNEAVRKLSRETRLSSSSLILPFFIKEGNNIEEDIPSLEGQKRYSPDRIVFAVEEALEKGVSSIILFGLPEKKDEIGSGGFDENGVVQTAAREIKKRFGKDILLITDVCMCEYTSHGHCGILKGEKVDNDETLSYLAKISLSHARAGADIVAPSDMMDGRVLAIRNSLDKNNFEDTLIMSYAVKYSSGFYWPFREAAGSAPAFGDRKTYQMDYHNAKEAIKEAQQDINEGCDMLIVKPAISYLDIVKEISMFNYPVVAYSVSGEYAMIKAAAKSELANEYALMCETAVGIFRAGANILITYYAKELADAIKRGDIG